jgi:hypothetical protein
MIQFSCPDCHTKLSAPPGSEGGQCDCPKCKLRLTIPGGPPARERVSSRRSSERDREEEDDRDDRRKGRDDDEDDDRSSRRRRRDEDEDDEDYPRRGRRGRFRCPYCDSDEPPAHRSDISAAGWITFAVLLMVCWPLCFIGLFIKEEYDVCRDCGRKVV